MSSYQDIVERIQSLSAERQQLYLRAAERGLTSAQRKRLGEIRVTLDELWLKRKSMRTQCTDPLELLMQARWQRGSTRMQ